MKLVFVACLPAGLVLTVPITANAQVDETAIPAPSEVSTSSHTGVLTGRQIREQRHAMIRDRQERQQAAAIARARRATPTGQSIIAQRITGMEITTGSDEDRQAQDAGDIAERNPLNPKANTAKDMASAPTATSTIQSGYGDEITPGSDEVDATTAIAISEANRKREQERIANMPGWLERVHAAIVEYWVACQVIRSLDAEADRPDPAWAKKFSENMMDMIAMAQDGDEMAMLTSAQAQATEAGYKRAQQEIIEKRKRIATIYADGNGKLFALSAIIFDPIKIIFLFVIAVIFRNPYRKIRMGIHLARMASVLERVERTRFTMPIGAGGGIESLPKNKQMVALDNLEDGITYLKKFEKLDVTDALIKNMQAAQRRNLHVRYDGMAKLLELLVKEGVAMDLEAWGNIRDVDIPNMILD